MRTNNLPTALGLLACLAATTVAAPARAETTLYCPFTAHGIPDDCLYTWQIKSDLDQVSDAAKGVSAVFSTLSSIYSGFNAVVSVAGFLGILHPGPTLDQKVDKILSEVTAIQQNTQAIISSVALTNRLEAADYDNNLLNFVVDQEGKSYGSLAVIHQANASGQPIDPATASLLTQETSEALFDLQNGSIWRAAPTPAHPSGVFDWRFAMAPYLYALGARISALTALNSPQAIASQWRSELHDDAAFILARVADTRQWTSERCAQPEGSDGTVGIGTTTTYECAYDQNECLAYDYYGNCTQWYWDPVCYSYLVTVSKKCDYQQAATTVGWDNQEAFVSPYHAGDDIEIASLHGLGIDTWMHTAAATHALAVGVTYAGCHSDDAARALPALLIAGNATIEACVQLAKAWGFNYAGLQNGQECWAGMSMGRNQLPDLTCGTPCAADGGEMCGGPWANSVFELQPSPDEPPAAAAGVRYGGCHAAGSLPTLLVSSGSTVASCAALGKLFGFAYAGLASGGACYVGNAPGSRLSELSCTTRCTADATQVCGGSNAVNVLELGASICPYGPSSAGGCN